MPEGLNFRDYQDFVESMIITEGSDRFVENSLGLAGETGEVCELLKKSVRDGYLDLDKLDKELGDVLFYVTAVAGLYERNLEDIFKLNKEKLTSRKERGVIKGSGDDR